MIRPQSVSRLVLWPSVMALVLAGCGSSGSDESGSGGQSASGGASATGGKTGSGGSTSSGGTTGSGGVTSSGGVTGTGGSVKGSGGASASGGTTGAGGRPTGTGGDHATGGTTSASGGAAGGRMGQAGAPGSGGGAGHAASGGSAGSTTTGSGGAAGGTSGGGGGSGTTPGMSAGCGTTPTIASSMYNNGSHITFMSGTQQRRYILNVPTNYDKTHPYKLIITYHELNGNDNEMYNQKYYNLLPQSNNTAIFIAPNGTQSSGSPCTGTGSGDSGCGWPNQGNADLTFVDALVKEIESNFCVDTTRIFADGWSYGGSMSYKTACERPMGAANGYIRGVAVYSGSQLSGTCTPTKPVAYYASHGTHDSVLNYSNGVGLAQNFAKANGCTWATPTSVTSGAHVCTNEMGCMAGYPLEFCSFNGDHTPFPDNGQESSSWNAANVWTFFNQF